MFSSVFSASVQELDGFRLVVAVNSVEGLVYVMAYACACIKTFLSLHKTREGAFCRQGFASVM